MFEAAIMFVIGIALGYAARYLQMKKKKYGAVNAVGTKGGGKEVEQ